MPPIVLKFLLKFWPHILGLLGLIAVGLMIYNSGRTAGEEAVQARWDKAIAAAQIEADKKEAEHAAVAKAMQDELTRIGGSLDAATARGRTLAGRLSAALSRPCLPQAPGAAPGADPAAGVPGDGGEVERAVGEHFAACARDAERLKGWQGWWEQVSE